MVSIGLGMDQPTMAKAITKAISFFILPSINYRSSIFIFIFQSISYRYPHTSKIIVYNLANIIT